MAKPSDSNDWDARKARVIGLGEQSFHKSYYPQFRENLDRLERFRTLLDRTTDFVVLIALPEASIADANIALSNLLGKPVNSLIGQPFASLGFTEAGKALDKLRDDVASGASESEVGSHHLEMEFVRGKENLWLELTCRAARLDDRFYGVIVGRDATDRKRAHEMVAGLLAEKEALLDNAIIGMAMLRDLMIVSCNRRFEAIFGYPEGGLLGQSMRLLYQTDEDYAISGKDAYRTMQSGQNFAVTIKLVRRDGNPFWCEIAGRAVDHAYPQNGSIWTFTDVTEHKQAEDRAKFLAYHDALTGLPNPLLLRDRLEQAKAFSERNGRKIALIVIDLDRFKTLNDFLGHQTGNRMLVDVATRMAQGLRPTDTLSRQGGDEFILLLTDLVETEAVTAFLGSFMNRVREPFRVDDSEFTVTCSSGIAIYPDDGADFDTLLKKSDMAMYRAKEAGRNTYRFFNEEMNSEAAEQITMHAGLWRALENQQFVLHYQPQFEIETGRLVGAEALLRWQHPEMGLVSPLRFIPVAEETGLIVPIGDWVLRKASRDLAHWLDVGMQVPAVSVNLSVVQFKRGEIEHSVGQALKESGIDPGMLELELTESILIRDTDNVLATVKNLKRMGVRLSIDDFGTGYSSLSYLKRFEVDKLKIDRSFVRDLVTDSEDAAIVLAIIQMARSLGLKTIAEGVETEAVLEMLRAYGCDEAQGYYCGRPMPADEFCRFLGNVRAPCVYDIRAQEQRML